MSINKEENSIMKPAIYINFDNKIKGHVTESNHKNWVEVTHIDFNIKRHLHTQTGHVSNREMSKPEFSAISVTKPLDATGALLAQEACSGKSIDKVVIHFCKTGPKGLLMLQEITLKDVYVSNFAINTANYGHQASESFGLNYSHIEIKGYPYDSAGKQQTPQTFGYDLKEAALA